MSVPMFGDGFGQAARTLYAFGNHASPLLVWREEQMPVGQGDQVVGDMPHNWASACKNQPGSQAPARWRS